MAWQVRTVQNNKILPAHGCIQKVKRHFPGFSLTLIGFSHPGTKDLSGSQITARMSCKPSLASLWMGDHLTKGHFGQWVACRGVNTGRVGPAHLQPAALLLLHGLCGLSPPPLHPPTPYQGPRCRQKPAGRSHPPEATGEAEMEVLAVHCTWLDTDFRAVTASCTTVCCLHDGTGLLAWHGIKDTHAYLLDSWQ